MFGSTTVGVAFGAMPFGASRKGAPSTGETFNMFGSLFTTTIYFFRIYSCTSASTFPRRMSKLTNM